MTFDNAAVDKSSQSPASKLSEKSISLPPLVFWLGSACRSVMPIVRELSALHNCPVTVMLTQAVADTRKQLGWGADSGGEARTIILEEASRGNQIEQCLNENPEAIHIVGAYQRAPILRGVALEVCRRHGSLFIMSEAPLNMDNGWRYHAKEAYTRYLLPRMAKPVIEGARGIFCLSGQRYEALRAIGWPMSKILPYGYFTADGGLRSHFRSDSNEPLRIVCMGFLRRYKGVDLLLRALYELKCAGVDVACDITGDGPDASRLHAIHNQLGLGDNVRFRGIVDESDLAALITDADVLACPGIVEPWAIRVNEAIQANLPLIISDRIGAADLVQTSGSGLVFRSGDVGELAMCLRILAEDRTTVLQMKRSAAAYRERIHPRVAASHLRLALASVLEGRIAPVAPWQTPSGIGCPVVTGSSDCGAADGGAATVGGA